MTMTSNDALMEATPEERPLDVNQALSSLWSLISESLEKGVATLVNDLNTLESTPTSARASTTQNQVAKFVTALGPKLEFESFRLHTLITDHILPETTSSTVLPTHAPYDQLPEIPPLLTSLAKTNKTVTELTQLNEKTQSQLTELKALWAKIPSQFPVSLKQLSETVRTAEDNLLESTRMVTALHPDAQLQNTTLKYPASSSTISSSLNNHTNSQSIVPTDEHDPLLFFMPAAADVFKAARRDGSVEDATPTICKFLMG